MSLNIIIFTSSQNCSWNTALYNRHPLQRFQRWPSGHKVKETFPSHYDCGYWISFLDAVEKSPLQSYHRFWCLQPPRNQCYQVQTTSPPEILKSKTLFPFNCTSLQRVCDPRGWNSPGENVRSFSRHHVLVHLCLHLALHNHRHQLAGQGDLAQLFVSKVTNETSKVEIWEASATLAFIPVMILTRYDDGLVNCQTQYSAGLFCSFWYLYLSVS